MPDPTLQGTALRYAAGDLSPDEVAAFESRLAEDQDARDALAEAVRLSAAAIGQKPPVPHPSFRAAIRMRLDLRAYRGHPFAWAGLGGVVVAACTLVGLSLGGHPNLPAAANAVPAGPEPVEVAPAPHPIEFPAAAGAPVVGEHGAGAVPENTGAAECGGEVPRTVAEIWAELSKPDHVEKARDDEVRWRHRARELAHPNHVLATAKAAGMADAPQP